MKSLIRKVCLPLYLSLLICSVSSSYSEQYKFVDGTIIQKEGVPILDTATSYLHVRERTNNDGTYVDLFLQYVGMRQNSKLPWCASFTSYSDGKTGNKVCKVKSASSAAYRKYMVPIQRILRERMKVPAGSILVFQQGNGSLGHVSIIYTVRDVKFYTIDGNSSASSKLERDANKGGVFPHIRTYNPNARLHIIGVVLNGQR